MRVLILIVAIVAGVWWWKRYQAPATRYAWDEVPPSDGESDTYPNTLSFELPEDVNSLIDKYSAEYGVNAQLLKAQAYVESRGNQSAISNKGAIGVFQLMPKTAEGLNVDPRDLEQNVQGGAELMSQLLRQYNGDTELALAAYNAGPGAVKKYGGVPPYKETTGYIAQIFAMLGF